MTRDEFVASVLAYADRQALPLETGTAVSTVVPDDQRRICDPHAAKRRPGTQCRRDHRQPQRAEAPVLAARLPAEITQIDGSDYRNAGGLRPGAVLVVGCGNSGGQIGEDLALAGRQVFLATGRNGRVPRRYRGRDIILWLMENGRYDQPRSMQSGRPLLGATHTISFGSLSALGVTLLGRITDVTASGTLVIRGRPRSECCPCRPGLGRYPARDRRLHCPAEPRCRARQHRSRRGDARPPP